MRRGWRGPSVKERTQVLSDMGFESYLDYLNSDMWKAIRARVLKRDGYFCSCGARAAVVHHNSYDKDSMTGDSIDALRSLCDSCHESVHFPESPRKKVVWCKCPGCGGPLRRNHKLKRWTCRVCKKIKGARWKWSRGALGRHAKAKYRSQFQ